MDRISDDSDALFDETAELLKSVASELRTYESYSDDEDEFFVYSKEAVDRSANSILAKYQNVSYSRLVSWYTVCVSEVILSTAGSLCML